MSGERRSVQVETLALAVSLCAEMLGCRPSDPPATGEHVRLVSTTAGAVAKPAFTEITAESGLPFVHDAGFDADDPHYLMPESMAPGAALFDMDGDGDLDIYLLQGADLEASPDAVPSRNQLFRNDGETLVNVTAASGLGDGGYGMGVAIGDIDNDGDLDVYVGNFGPDSLYRNNGDGSFVEVTKSAGIRDTRWSASAAFFDYDRDGWLDLFVTGYLAYDPRVTGRDAAGAPEYPGPQLFAGVDALLYHNNGDGTFTDVSASAGVAPAPGRGLGLACADFNDDGWPDVFVANDREPNRLWINRRNGTFVDQAFAAGVAVDGLGKAEANMGVALGDIDGDLDLDLFSTCLVLEGNVLYRNEGAGLFTDATIGCGLNGPSLPFTSFGTAFLDYDHDGDLDLAIVNGRVRRDVPHPRARVSEHWKPYAEPNLFLENTGRGVFQDISSAIGPFCDHVEVSRGLVSGDIDNDGDLDLLVTTGGGPARLFRNDASQAGHWLTIRAVDPALRRDALGAWVEVSAGGRRRRRDLNGGFSYLCSGDFRAHFGLGGAAHVEAMTVHWPDGTVESFAGVGVDRFVELVKGSGIR